jgi:ribosomal protein S18 acetylase RimI-like enzyme
MSACVRRLLDPTETEIAQLADVLTDCVEGGASVSFMLPMTAEKSLDFWRRVAADVRNGTRILLVAEDALGIVGTVQVVLDMPENQPHRGDLAKMLVHRSARNRGVGTALLRAAEDAAREAGRTLLVLDTVSGSAGERLYRRLGWSRVGEVPDYALWPGGGFCPTTYYYRRIG